MTGPEVIGPRNMGKHLDRIHTRKLEKEQLRRDDRRRNFETGESVGLLLATGSISIIAAWRGGLAALELEIWQRISIALLGLILLVVQHVMRRRFYNKTEAPLTKAKQRKDHVDDSRS